MPLIFLIEKKVNVVYILQSASLSGISWYDLSSVQTGLIVSIPFSHEIICAFFCLSIGMILGLLLVTD